MNQGYSSKRAAADASYFLDGILSRRFADSEFAFDEKR